MIEHFIPPNQLAVLQDKNNEEQLYFNEILNTLTARISNLPVTYQTANTKNPTAY